MRKPITIGFAVEAQKLNWFAQLVSRLRHRRSIGFVNWFRGWVKIPELVSSIGFWRLNFFSLASLAVEWKLLISYCRNLFFTHFARRAFFVISTILTLINSDVKALRCVGVRFCMSITVLVLCSSIISWTDDKRLVLASRTSGKVHLDKDPCACSWPAPHQEPKPKLNGRDKWWWANWNGYMSDPRVSNKPFHRFIRSACSKSFARWLWPIGLVIDFTLPDRKLMSNWFAQLVSAPGLAGLEAELNWFRQLVSPPP